MCNYPSSVYRLVHHEMWIRASPLLQKSKELILINFSYSIHGSLFHSTPFSICLGPFPWSNHIRNLMEPSIHSVPVQSFILVSLLHIPQLLPAASSQTPLSSKDPQSPILRLPSRTPITRHCPSLLSSRNPSSCPVMKSL